MPNRFSFFIGLMAFIVGVTVFVSRSSGPDVTYHDQVSRIIQAKCQTCHRQGGVGPFPFETYEEVYARRGMIQYVVENGIMPPWFADSGVGHWSNDRSLEPEQRATLLEWIASGAPAGDPSDAPEPKTYASGWNLGEPDYVVRLPEPYAVPAEGIVDYQYIDVETNLPEDRWVRAMEILPTRRDVVHHVLVMDPAPPAEGDEDARPRFRNGIDGYYAVYVPGFQGNTYPEGSAKLLRAGATMRFQVHYTTNGVATEDQTELGFYFADGPPDLVVETGSAYDTRFEIPPGNPNFAAEATYRFEQPGRLLSLFPHLHLRGKAFRYDLVYPDGREEPLLNVPRYDFNWQLTYILDQPIDVPAGTELRIKGVWDNSEANPFNPDPGATVHFGEQTFDEMLIGYFDWIATGPAAATDEDGDGPE